MPVSRLTREREISRRILRVMETVPRRPRTHYLMADFFCEIADRVPADWELQPCGKCWRTATGDTVHFITPHDPTPDCKSFYAYVGKYPSTFMRSFLADAAVAGVEVLRPFELESECCS